MYMYVNGIVFIMLQEVYTEFVLENAKNNKNRRTFSHSNTWTCKLGLSRFIFLQLFFFTLFGFPIFRLNVVRPNLGLYFFAFL